MTSQEKVKFYAKRVEAAFKDWTPPAATRPAVLHEAMQYSLCAGGKRIRPVLLLAAFDVFPSAEDPLPACVAIECLHTYSLIHDDLPCMDNSDLRRGRPTCHKQFDEPTALLAGDALLTHALTLLAKAYSKKPELATALICDLGDAAGSRGMIAGQVEDMLGERGDANAERLNFIHQNKTGALITAAITMGFRLGNAPAGTIETAKQIGANAGVAFQIIDDILDVTSDAATMGKPVGADCGNSKLTYPRFHGMEKSRTRAHELTKRALDLCGELGGESQFLSDIIRDMENRIS